MISASQMRDLPNMAFQYALRALSLVSYPKGRGTTFASGEHLLGSDTGFIAEVCVDKPLPINLHTAKKRFEKFFFF